MPQSHYYHTHFGEQPLSCHLLAEADSEWDQKQLWNLFESSVKEKNLAIIYNYQRFAFSFIGIPCELTLIDANCIDWLI